MPPHDRRIAWSSNGPPPAPKSKSGPAPSPPGRARVRLERQGRGGKVVSVVENLPGHPEGIAALASTLKARCGAGGTVKGRTIEIQGDHRERIVLALAEQGIEAVKSGG